MPLYIVIIVCVAAGILAGLSTGFAGLSACVFITPFLASFLGEDYFQAVAIALASDVLASAVSTIVYKKHKNLEFKSALPLFISILFGAVGGSVVSYLVVFGAFKSVETGFGNELMTYGMLATEIGLGIFFIINAILKDRKKNNTEENTDTKKKEKKPLSKNVVTILSILIGLGIGFICGFEGAGGGMLILLALTGLLKFDFKKAIGTSVLIMTFTALIGAITHYVIMFQTGHISGAGVDISWESLVFCVVATTGFALLGSFIANKINPTSLRIIVGAMILISAIASLVFKLVTL